MKQANVKWNCSTVEESVAKVSYKVKNDLRKSIMKEQTFSGLLPQKLCSL